jgi:hypothetical protein
MGQRTKEAWDELVTTYSQETVKYMAADGIIMLGTISLFAYCGLAWRMNLNDVPLSKDHSRIGWNKLWRPRCLAD